MVYEYIALFFIVEVIDKVFLCLFLMLYQGLL